MRDRGQGVASHVFSDSGNIQQSTSQSAPGGVVISQAHRTCVMVLCASALNSEGAHCSVTPRLGDSSP